MSEKQRRRRKDETWTKDELTSALRGKDDRTHKKERSRTSDKPHSSSDRHRDRKSHHGLDKVNGEEEDYEKRRSKQEDRERRHREDRNLRTDDRRRSDSKRSKDEERRHKERNDDDEYRKDREKRKREKERRENERRNEERPEKSDKERRHRDREDKRQRHRDAEEPALREKERSHRDKRDKKSRNTEEDEQDARRRERREEKKRRQEEESKQEEREKRHREKDRSSKRSSEHKSHKEDSTLFKVSKSSSKQPKQEEIDDPVETAEETYNYDDEEFEDYEDDFEDEDTQADDDEAATMTPEVDAIIQAMKQENERVASARTMSSKSDRYDSSTPTDVDSTSSQHVMSTNINFSAAKQRKSGNRARQKILKRRNDLLTLIQLDVMSFDLFDLPPVTEYNFYIKNFGSQNSRQISTQCNDDALEIETQTDSPEVVEKWTQQPQDGVSACGGVTNEPDANRRDHMLSVMRDGSQRFSSFLTYASNIMESSFAEATIWSDNKDAQRSSLSCCESCTKFNTNLSYLQGRKILHTVFGDGVMAVSFGMSDHQISTRIDRKGIITVWKATNTEKPDKILVCDALPITCCFVPQNKNLLFVGTDDGTVLVYDLTEPSTMHQCIEIERNNVTVLRNPTYSTAAVEGSLNEIHSSPVVCLNPVGTFQNSNQIFSLEEGARICVWIVVEILLESDDDKGLVPHGRFKLVKSISIDVASSKSAPTTDLGCRTTCAVCPDSNVFYVGTDTGQVASLSRDRKLRTYRSHGVGEVTSIAISRLNMSLMLASYSDGSLTLFHTKQESPIMTWPLAGGSVLFCDWSNCRSSVFFALDSSNQLHVWDLMAVDSAPVVTDLFPQKTLRFCVDKQTNKTTNLMVAYETCSFEIHRISPHFTDSVTSDEAEQMMSLVMSFS